jgi:G3E family GTPase
MNATPAPAPVDADSHTARYVMIGGFLGAGKSTAVLALARHLRDRGVKAGLITNDQSVGLVDTAFMRSAGFDVQEIPGGCFCCRFNSLVEAADKLTADATPGVFIAEPVGSCTDLVASVSYPLRRLYGDRYQIAPLSVVVDPIRARRVLGLDSGRSFSEKIVYVYRKQLEEADLIVVNKRELIGAASLKELVEALGEQFPQAKVLSVSARQGTGMDEWFKRILQDRIGDRPTMGVDYRVYAEGEALLGWLNMTVRLEADAAFDGEKSMMDLAERVRAQLNAAGAEIAHLKMTLMSDDQPGQAAVLNLVRNDFVPELAQSLPERVRRGRLVVNLRAEADPRKLDRVTRSELHSVMETARPPIRVVVEHADHFRPSEPRPTWRMKDATTLEPFVPA